MNMKQTLERLEAIADAKIKADLLSTMLSVRNSNASKGVVVDVYGAKGEHYDNHGRQCIIDADLLPVAIKNLARSVALFRYFDFYF